MYSLHLNYTITLPYKTITMKITTFIIVLVLNIEIKWKFDISDSHRLLTVQNSLFQDVLKVSAASFHTSFHTSLKSFGKAQYGLVDGVLWQIITYYSRDIL